MGLCHGKSTTDYTPCCPNLPPEVAGEILSRLPSHDDRLSFKSVCRGWRLAARQQGPLLPPSMPCINLGHGMYQSIGGNRRRFSMPKGFRAGASFDGWVLYAHKRSGRYFLRDPFSTSTPDIEVPCSYHPSTDIVQAVCDPRSTRIDLGELLTTEKIIVCSPCLIVMTLRWGVFNHAPANFACFCPGARTLLWSHVAGICGDRPHNRCDSLYNDIVFHVGKIFTLSGSEYLFTHSLVGDALSQSRPDHVIKEPPATAIVAATNYQHLVTSSDKQKLMMVRWSIPSQTNDNKVNHHMINLRVFEAELDNGRWMEVQDLGGQILFVGQAGSRAFMAESSSKHYYGRRFRGGNCVVLLGHEWALAPSWADAAPCRCPDCQKLANGFPSYYVYDMASGETSLVSLNGGHGSKKSSKAQWFFPSE